MNNFTLVSLLILFVLLISGAIYWTQTSLQNKDEKVEKDFICEDSDYGKNYYQKGEINPPIKGEWGINYDTCAIKPDITLENVKIVETCEGSDCVLVELYCPASEYDEFKQFYKCPAGCSQGKCNKEDIHVKGDDFPTQIEVSS